MKSNPPLISNLKDVSEQARVLYDTWTDDYDQKLLIDCEYRSPARVAQVFHQSCALLTERTRPPRAEQPWLDLGAGSGLVGHALAQAGIHLPLIAIDFSSTMLSKLTCASYIACFQTDVLTAEALRASPGWPTASGGAFAIGLSEYVADLNELLRVCAALLPEQSLLIFSYCPSPTADCEIFEPFAGLLAHSEQAVTQALTTQGFALLSHHDGPGYRSAGQQVMHRIVVAQRCS